MNRDKQIEEMAKITCQMYRREKEKKCAGVQECDCKCLHYNRCEALYNLGYRKASEVAREIFEEIEERLRELADESKILRDKEINLGEKTQLNGEWIGVRLALRDIAELKKKYEVEV